MCPLIKSEGDEPVDAIQVNLQQFKQDNNKSA
jgi:hypothetical protein